VLDERGALPLILGEVRSDGAELRYAYGAEGLTAQQTISNTAATISYPLLDGQGSLRRLTDAAGAVTLARSYDAFGNIRHSAGAGWSPLGFTGERMGVADGTLYLRARHYSPALGRFLQRDSYAGTAGRPQSLNRYAYTENNPATLSDPSGHCHVCIAAGVGAVIGAGIAYGTQVYQNYQAGQSGGDAWTNVNAKSIVIGAVVGAVAGGVGAAAGPALVGMAGKGLLGAISAGALEGMAAGSASQLVANLLHGCLWSDNMVQSLLISAATGGLGGALGSTQGRAFISPAIRKITPKWLIDQAIARLELQMARYGLNAAVDKEVQLQLLKGEIANNSESVASAMRRALEMKRTMYGEMNVPTHISLQLDEISTSNLNIYQFLEDWDLRIW
jgi:RHS repeat-associated protein